MKIPGDLLYYQLFKTFPACLSYMENKYAVTAPMFWTANNPSFSYRLVVIPEHVDAQIVHHYKNVIFLCSKKYAVEMHRFHNDYILMPQLPSLDILFNRLMEIFTMLQNWFSQLEDAVSTEYSFTNAIDACDPLLEDPIALVDGQFRYVCYSKNLARENGFEEKYVDGKMYLPLEQMNMLTAHSDFRKKESFHHVFRDSSLEDMLHINLFFKNQYVGRLGLSYPKDHRKRTYYICILKIMAEYIQKIYSRYGSFRQHNTEEHELKDCLVELLQKIYKRIDRLEYLLSQRGWEANDELILLQFSFSLNQQEEQHKNRMQKTLANHLENLWPGTYCIIYEGHLLALVNLTFFQKSSSIMFSQAVAVMLRESLLLAGVSRHFSHLEDICAAHEQTRISLDIGTKTDATKWYFRFDDYAMQYLLQYGFGSFFPEQICDKTILILMDYDKKNGTELNLTLKVFIQQKYNAVAAAKILYIARSTFLKRMDRIRELTGVDLDDYQSRLYLVLSYAVMDQFSACLAPDSPSSYFKSQE